MYLFSLLCCCFCFLMTRPPPESTRSVTLFPHPTLFRSLGGGGITDAEARNRLGGGKIYTSDFRPMKNVPAERNERALYKLVVDDTTQRVVGVHLIGPDPPEILQMVAVAVKALLTKAQFDVCVVIHLTMAEKLVLLT